MHLHREKEATEKRNNSATQTGTICKATHDGPLSKGQTILTEGVIAARERLIQNARHRQEGPIRRPFKESAKMNQPIHFACRGMASILDGFSYGAHHHHRYTTTTASQQRHRSQLQHHCRHQLFQQLATSSLASELDGQGRGGGGSSSTRDTSVLALKNSKSPPTTCYVIDVLWYSRQASGRLVPSIYFF